MPTLQRSDLDVLKALASTCTVEKFRTTFKCDDYFVLTCYPETSPQECRLALKDVRVFVYHDDHLRRSVGYYEPVLTPIRDADYWLHGFKEIYSILSSRYVPPPPPVQTVTPTPPPVETTKPKTIDEILTALERYAEERQAEPVDLPEARRKVKEMSEPCYRTLMGVHRVYAEMRRPVNSLIRAMAVKDKVASTRFYNEVVMFVTSRNVTSGFEGLEACRKTIDTMK